MITFFRTPDCPGCGEIQDILEELCLAHKVILLQGNNNISELPQGTHPPVLVDGDEVIQGPEAIVAHLEWLEGFKALWEKYQSDACYCDEEGRVE
jgi:hypothetical protein